MIVPSPTYLGLYFGPEARILKDIHCSGVVLQMSKGNDFSELLAERRWTLMAVPDEQ